MHFSPRKFQMHLGNKNINNFYYHLFIYHLIHKLVSHDILMHILEELKLT